MGKSIVNFNESQVISMYMIVENKLNKKQNKL